MCICVINQQAAVLLLGVPKDTEGALAAAGDN